jgi:hypothetical protein
MDFTLVTDFHELQSKGTYSNTLNSIFHIPGRYHVHFSNYRLYPDVYYQFVLHNVGRKFLLKSSIQTYIQQSTPKYVPSLRTTRKAQSRSTSATVWSSNRGTCNVMATCYYGQRTKARTALIQVQKWSFGCKGTRTPENFHFSPKNAVRSWEVSLANLFFCFRSSAGQILLGMGDC